METKKCSTCGKYKPVTEFGPSKVNNDGLRGSCRECHNAYQREYNRKNRKKILTIGHNSYMAHRESRAEKKSAWYKRTYKAERVGALCEICSAPAAIRHHACYGKTPVLHDLCRKCHSVVHRAVRELMRLALTQQDL